MLRKWGAFGLGLPVGAALMVCIDYLVFSIRNHQADKAFDEWEESWRFGQAEPTNVTPIRGWGSDPVA